MKTLRSFGSVALGAALVAALPAFAGPGAGHGHGPRHGGVVREVKGASYELVAKPDSLVVHVSDHGKPLATEGAQAKATIYAGAERSEVTLEPGAGGTLAAKGAFRTGVGTRVALVVRLKGQAEQKMTFNLK